MKLIAVANGNEFEADDEAAKELIATGLYKAANEKPKKSAEPTKARKPQK